MTTAFKNVSSRSKFAVDVMWRLWDVANQCFLTHNSRTIWTQKNAVERLRAEVIEKNGRTPESLEVLRVFVEVK